MMSQSPRPRIRELPIHWIQYGPEKNASRQANVDKHSWLIPVNSSIEHVHDTNRRRRRGQRLQTDCLQCTVRVQRDDANRLIFTTDSLCERMSA